MRHLFNRTLVRVIGHFEELERQVPPPQRVPYLDGFVFRYVERTIRQAMILKLARRISGLRAALILLDNGHVQEQAVMQRIMGELDDDIQFLVLAVTNDKVTPLHERYLEDFFQEEFDVPGDPVASTQKRGMIPRRKSHAYLAKFSPPGMNPSDGVRLSNTLHKAYSGFVHGAAPQVLELYGGSPPHFHLSGMLGTPRIEEYAGDLWNYFYRGIQTCALVAKGFGGQELVDTIYNHIEEFEQESGTSYHRDARPHS